MKKKRLALFIILFGLIAFSTACVITDIVSFLLEEDESAVWDDESYSDWEEDPVEETVFATKTKPASSADAGYGGDIETDAISCVVNVEPFSLNANDIPNIDVSDWLSEEDEVLPIIRYDVSEDDISNPSFESDIPDELVDIQNNQDIHQQTWEFFTTLIPYEYRTYLVEFRMMTDGEDEILASVYQSEDDPYTWGLEVDIVDIDDTYELFATLMHEYGHLLSLNPSQVEPSLAIFDDPEDDDRYYSEVDACPNYFPGEGCSYEDSYINLFVGEFWGDDIYNEWNEVDLIEDEDEYYDALDQFYYEHEDEFVSDYAVTNPDEDFGESFSAFIMEPEPDGTRISEDKILFFYGFPELVELRASIISQLCGMVE